MNERSDLLYLASQYPTKLVDECISAQRQGLARNVSHSLCVQLAPEINFECEAGPLFANVSEVTTSVQVI